jgi:propanol-preferring alcohol dehydrogenase
MRAAVLPDYGKPLELTELPVPDPAPGEVLVRVAGAGLCHSDLHLSTGELPMLPSLPWVLGHEVTGYVEAYGSPATVAAQGSRLEHGTPVAVFGGWGCGRCAVCLGGEEQLCSTTSWAGIGRPGGFAEYLLVPAERHLVPLADLDPVTSAPLTDAALTPYRAVRKVLPRLVPGTTAVVIGAGGLGQYAVQQLRALSPARVVVVETSAARRALALDVGADLAIGPEDVDDAGVAGRATAVLDIVGSQPTLDLAGRLAAPGGRVVIVGLGGGALPTGFLSPAAEVVVGSSYWGNRNELAQVVALAQRGLLVSHVHEVDLSGAETAMRDLEAGAVDGRIVLVP